MKNIQYFNVYKEGYIDFCCQTPLSPQNGHALPHMGFSQFFFDFLIVFTQNELSYRLVKVLQMSHSRISAKLV